MISLCSKHQPPQAKSRYYKEASQGEGGHAVPHFDVRPQRPGNGTYTGKKSSSSRSLFVSTESKSSSALIAQHYFNAARAPKVMGFAWFVLGVLHLLVRFASVKVRSNGNTFLWYCPHPHPALRCIIFPASSCFSYSSPIHRKAPSSSGAQQECRPKAAQRL